MICSLQICVITCYLIVCMFVCVSFSRWEWSKLKLSLCGSAFQSSIKPTPLQPL